MAEPSPLPQKPLLTLWKMPEFWQFPSHRCLRRPLNINWWKKLEFRGKRLFPSVFLNRSLSPLLKSWFFAAEPPEIPPYPSEFWELRCRRGVWIALWTSLPDSVRGRGTNPALSGKMPTGDQRFRRRRNPRQSRLFPEFQGEKPEEWFRFLGKSPRD